MDTDSPRKTDSLTRFEPLLLFLVFYLPGYLLQSRHIGGQLFNSVTFNVTYLLEAIPRILLLLYIILIRANRGGEGGSWKGSLERLGFRRYGPTEIVWTILLLVTIEVVVVPLSLLGSALSAHGIGGNPVHWQLDSPALLPLVFLTCMAAGYSEELFFRSYLLTELPRLGIGIWPAVAASTLLFGLGHLYEGVTGLLGTVAIGLILSVVFLKKRNLHLIAVAHGLYNFVTLFATLSNGKPFS